MASQEDRDSMAMEMFGKKFDDLDAMERIKVGGKIGGQRGGGRIHEMAAERRGEDPATAPMYSKGGSGGGGGEYTTGREGAEEGSGGMMEETGAAEEEEGGMEQRSSGGSGQKQKGQQMRHDPKKGESMGMAREREVGQGGAMQD